MKATELRVPAIQVHQGPGRTLYTFAIDGKLVERFAAVSRVRRDATGISGYQRPEVLSHIAEIRNYIESEAPMVPNPAYWASGPLWPNRQLDIITMPGVFPPSRSPTSSLCRPMTPTAPPRSMR